MLAHWLHVGKSLEDFRKCHLSLNSSQRESQANVRAKTKGKVGHAIALQIELIGVCKNPGVAVGRVKHHEYAVTGLQGFTV